MGGPTLRVAAIPPRRARRRRAAQWQACSPRARDHPDARVRVHAKRMSDARARQPSGAIAFSARDRLSSPTYGDCTLTLWCAVALGGGGSVRPRGHIWKCDVMPNVVPKYVVN